jgi:hypothetical protein
MLFYMNKLLIYTFDVQRILFLHIKKHFCVLINLI